VLWRNWGIVPLWSSERTVALQPSEAHCAAQT
jgi:hypothetical protein